MMARILLLGSLFLAFFSQKTLAQVGTPIYGVQADAMCWTVNGQDSTIFVANVHFLGTSQPTRVFYFDQYGNSVTGVTDSLEVGPCGIAQLAISSIGQDSIHYIETSLAGQNDTIPAGSVSAVTICNTGVTTNLIFVGDQNMRMIPGECYIWKDYFDRQRGKWVTNPQIVLFGGNINENEYRVWKHIKK